MFQKITSNTTFSRKLGIVVINKLYLVLQQGLEGNRFRSKFRELSQNRKVFPSYIRQYSYTIILEPTTIPRVREATSFRRSFYLQRDSINRPAIIIRVAIILLKIQNVKSLTQVVRNIVNTEGKKVPLEKTLIFIDSRKTIYTLAKELRLII